MRSPRSRELRLGRSLRGIVMTVLASPLGGTMACHSTATPADASAGSDVAEDAGSAPTTGDAGGDATLSIDATLSETGTGTSPSSGRWDLDGACALIALDGTATENTQDGCAAFHLAPCGLPASAQLQGCVVDLATCIAPCNSAFFLYCQLAAVSCDDAGNRLDADTVVECISCGGISGRRPLGLRAPALSARTPLGDYFAAMAHLESASVRAFRDLEAWLTANGAPASLSRAARRSAADEQRHTRAASRLARRFGGTTTRPRVRAVTVPALLALLEDDAIEGCVNETFGALLATWQAARARDPRVRRTMARIAADETRHAALAWEILAWGMTRLDEEERRRIERTLTGALAALVARRPDAYERTVHEVAGHPAPAEERRLVQEFVSVVMRQRPSGASPFGYEIAHDFRPPRQSASRRRPPRLSRRPVARVGVRLEQRSSR